MNRYAIIVAGGRGSRFGSVDPKQFVELAGMPMIFYPLNVFNGLSEIILVLPSDYTGHWRSVIRLNKIRISHSIVEGGDTRAGSVKNGLGMIPDDEKALVAVHDGARPLISAKLAAKAFEEAEEFGSAVPVIPVNDTIRDITGHSTATINRDRLRKVQTPQVFQLQTLLDAYQQELNPSFTDDASLVEALGQKVHYFTGETTNFKVTTQEDLFLAEAWLKNKRNL
jgi:2-C-methyl-D-erythritol 4-phosphate cytidylyltransferase